MEESFEIEEISKDLNALSIEIGVSKGRGNIIICNVNSPYFRKEILNFLEKRFTLESANIKEGDGDKIIKKLKQKESEKDALIWIMPENLSSDIENALNNYRELFYDYPVPSIIFCNELFLNDVIKKAPDFWRYRGNFYRFEKQGMGLAYKEALYSTTSFSFKTKADLLRRERINKNLLKITKDKKQKINLLLEINEIYCIFGNFKKEIELTNECLEIAKEINYKAGESKCYQSLGAAYRNLGDFRKAIEFYEKSLKISKEISDKSEESNSYRGLGNAYHSLGDFIKAIEYYEKSLEISKESRNRLQESRCYRGLGNAYYSLGNFSKAIEYNDKSLEIDKEIGDKSGESKCYGNLGNIYQGLGDFSKAIEFYDKSLKIFKEIGDKSGESRCYANLGSAYMGLGDFSKAIEYFEKSEAILKKTGEVHNLKVVYENMSIVYKEMKNFEKAEEYKRKAEELAWKLN